MSVKAKKKMSKKLIASIVILALVSLASIAGIVTVLALTQRNIDSAIFIRFTAIDIDGEVEAQYRVGTGEWKPMGDKHVFNAADEEENAQMNPGNIALSSANNFVEFKYTFRNFGDADYTGLLTLDEVTTENNMKIEYKYNDEEYSTSSYGLVVEGVDTASADKIKTRGEEKYTEMTYYIKVSVAELSKSANYSSDFFWLLERYDGEVSGEVIPLATSTYTANGDGTYSASYNGSNISTGSTSAGSAGVSNVWIVPNNLGSAAITKVVKGDDLPANTKVVLGDNVTTIEEGTFTESSGLVEIVLGKGITEISDDMFVCCSNLRSVTIGENVTSIGYEAFSFCLSLANITIPDSLISVEGYAFESCISLTSVVIGSGVTSIESSAFPNCSSLTSIEVDEENTVYASEGNCLLNKAKTELIIGCNTSVIPSTVTSIGNSAFSSCSGLTSIEIPASVTSIGEYAFQYCTSLTSIVIPDSVTSIGSGVFNGCTGLTSVVIGSGVTSIGGSAFSGCYKLVEIYDLRTTQMSAGDYGTNSEVKILSAGDSPVVHTDSNGIQYFEYETGKYKILNYTGTNTEVTIPSTYNGGVVTEIRQYAFYQNKNITKVTISEGITTIGDYAFQYCTSLTSVVIGSGVTSIGRYAFQFCSSLTSVEFKNTSGWYVAISSSATSGTSISETDLANTSTAATYLKSTYMSRYWKRG